MVDVGGCSLHHIHNAVQYAVQKLSDLVEEFMDDVYNYFRYGKRRHAFKNLCTRLIGYG